MAAFLSPKSYVGNVFLALQLGTFEYLSDGIVCRVAVAFFSTSVFATEGYRALQVTRREAEKGTPLYRAVRIIRGKCVTTGIETLISIPALLGTWLIDIPIP